MKTDVLIIGGGASGICAAIQSARMGVETTLIEETPWLGGMLTAAGVSAIDGNHRLPSGLWGEFRERLYQHYGGAEALHTGWVSQTLFEPHIGARIFMEMAAETSYLSILRGYRLLDINRDGNRVIGGEVITNEGQQISIRAGITIDATEYGDALALAGCAYDLGRDGRENTGEAFAAEVPDGAIQDLTYVAILKVFGNGSDRRIPEPPNYDPSRYHGCCREAGGGEDAWSCEKMIDYGRLPNDKIMINWPIQGNDWFLDITEMTHEKRSRALQAAKDQTLGFVYFIQTELGQKHLGFADDEFPTADRFPFIPYIRESRRLRGITRLTVNDILDPYHAQNKNYYRSGIAVGDYPLDHHHEEHPEPVKEEFPSIPAFTVPYGCLVPETVDGLLVAEKSISVTHLVNGCTRLQPVVMQLGQAAGAAAALSVKQSVQPRQIDIRELQQILLQNNTWLMPFNDIVPTDWAFSAVQRVAVCGIMKGKGVSKGWSNEMHFSPQNPLTLIEAAEVFSEIPGVDSSQIEFDTSDNHQQLSRELAAQTIWKLLGSPQPRARHPLYADVPETHSEFFAAQYLCERGWGIHWAVPPEFYPQQPITKAELAFLVDAAFTPFNQKID